MYKFVCILCLLFITLYLKSQKFVFTKDKLGSPFSITISAKDTSLLYSIIDEGFSMVDSMDFIFSDYKENSEVSKINRSKEGNWISISLPMMDLLLTAQMACLKSNGSFDITIGQLTNAWRKARKENKLDDPSRIDSMRSKCGCNQYRVDISGRKMMKANSDFALDFGGIAKGYIAEQVGLFLKKKGFARYLIDAGGDLVAGEKPINEKAWKLAIELPSADNEFLKKMVMLKNRAIATSGSTYQYCLINGKIYSHILDPKSGLGISVIKNVTIIAPNGTDADWLATACSIIPEDKIESFVSRHKKTTCIITYFEGEKAVVKNYGAKVN